MNRHKLNFTLQPDISSWSARRVSAPNWHSEIAGKERVREASRDNIINATLCVLCLGNFIEHQTFESNSVASKTWSRKMWSKGSERDPIMSSANSSLSLLSFLCLDLRAFEAGHGYQRWISCEPWADFNWLLYMCIWISHLSVCP